MVIVWGKPSVATMWTWRWWSLWDGDGDGVLDAKMGNFCLTNLHQDFKTVALYTYGSCLFQSPL